MKGSKANAVAITKPPSVASGKAVPWIIKMKAPQGPLEAASKYSKSIKRRPDAWRYHVHFNWLSPLARGKINADLDTSDEIATIVFRVIVECHSWSGRLLNLMRTVNIAKKDTKERESARLSKIHQDSTTDSRGRFGTGAVKFGGV
jgi:hypothetical protein